MGNPNASIFTATFSAVAVTAAQDLFEITAAGTAGTGARRVGIRQIRIGQYSDFGDAQAEILSITLIRGYTVTGSGGTTVTPAPTLSAAAVALSTVKANNTTVANTGTAATLIADVMNVAAGWIWQCATDLSDVKWLAGGERGVLRLSVPADSLTMNGTIWFEER